MADPVTIALIATAASTAMSAAGAIQQGQAAAAQGRAQQQAQEYNAVVKEQNAQLSASRQAHAKSSNVVKPVRCLANKVRHWLRLVSV